MNATQQAPRPAISIGPALPIVMTIIWAIVMIVVLMLALFSLMAFDSGSVSTGMGMLVAGIWMVVILCPVSVIGGWIAWAITRRHAGGARILRGIVYALPLVGVVVFGIGWAIG